MSRRPRRSPTAKATRSPVGPVPMGFLFALEVFRSQAKVQLTTTHRTRQESKRYMQGGAASQTSGAIRSRRSRNRGTDRPLSLANPDRRLIDGHAPGRVG